MIIDSDEVKRIAEACGFDACGIARAEALGEEEYPLNEWLRRGWHAEMQYMERNAAMRRDPRLLVEGARSVICVALGYNPSRLIQGQKRIARYAYATDYHLRVKQGLHQMAAMIEDRYHGFEAKACCDTAPISDKHWAARAGLGFIGRHTLLVTPEWGTWVNLGELVTAAECSAYDSPTSLSPCAHCGRCLEACPTKALAPDGPPMLDARRCIAYQTIESRAEALPVATHGFAFGCDLCQEACPYNAKAKTIEMPVGRIDVLEQLPMADEATFRRLTRHTAIDRIRYSQWQRNLNQTNNQSQ